LSPSRTHPTLPFVALFFLSLPPILNLFLSLTSPAGKKERALFTSTPQTPPSLPLPKAAAQSSITKPKLPRDDDRDVKQFANLFAKWKNNQTLEASFPTSGQYSHVEDTSDIAGSGQTMEQSYWLW